MTVVVLMGVSGAGKTTVGRLLAVELGWRFYEGDDFHPPANVEKIRGGVPLTDEDRRPWLARLRALIEELLARGEDGVIACSALKEAYRRQLSGGDPRVRFVYLKVDAAILAERLERRRGHFLKGPLLASQLAILEEPADALAVDGGQSPEAIVREIRERL